MSEDKERRRSASIQSQSKLEKRTENAETSAQRIAIISSLSSNLPAVLNNPSKGKQRDFFTRTWGEEFSESYKVPLNPNVRDIAPRVFDKYLRKLHKYRSPTICPQQRNGVIPKSSPLSVMPRMFWDPNLKLSNPDTFAQVFPFAGKRSSGGVGAEASSDRLVQEKLAHFLDLVEVDIAEQVAQKSQHFFEVMTYHDVLMTQLVGLVKHVENLRGGLKHVDQSVFYKSLEIVRLERRRRNARMLADKLAVMSHLHQTQPKIQLLLSGNEFSGALDLITTSRDVLSVDLEGVVSFRHLSSQLHEIQSIIGKMLLGDFQTYISDEIRRDVTHEKATVITNKPISSMESADSDQLKSVILGLLRQNSYTFLEVLDGASITAVKNVLKEVALEMLMTEKERNEDTVSTLTSLAAEFAKTAPSQEWIEFFDVLLGSLISLLRRIFAIHSVIMSAIQNTSNTTSNAVSTVENATVLIPEQQLKNLQVTSHDVLVNVCDQVVERSSKILTQRSKAGAAKHISVEELKHMAEFVDILNKETVAMTGKSITGFQLSLQGQTLLYIQAFHDEKRLELSDLLEKEKWKKSDEKFVELEQKFEAVPSLHQLFFQADISHQDGAVTVEDSKFTVTWSTQQFLVLLSEYCVLCSNLPSIAFELGLKTAEIIKFYNSRICQLVLGVGAISVSGLKTITIRNLALARRSLELIINVIPTVRDMFENVQGMRNGVTNTSNNMNNNNELKALGDSKQYEALCRQFDQAVGHLSNHVKELDEKILSVVESILQQHLTTWTYSAKGTHQIPSSNFKALCKQLTKLHESVADIWSPKDLEDLMVNVHNRFMSSVKFEISARKLNKLKNVNEKQKNELLSEARAFKSELTFYSQSLLRLNVIPEEMLSQQELERVWE